MHCMFGSMFCFISDIVFAIFIKAVIDTCCIKMKNKTNKKDTTMSEQFQNQIWRGFV